MKITIREIAKQAGVSISTASRAMNGHPDVSDQVRERVKNAASELNFSANPHARALVAGSSRTIGFIVENTAAPFIANIVSGVLDCVTRHGYKIMIFNTNDDPSVEEKAYRTLLNERVMGILITSVKSGSSPFLRLQEEGMPFVLVNRRCEGLETDWVIGDLRHGYGVLVKHLYDLGHRHIAALPGNYDQYAVRERVIGYRLALQDLGLPYRSEYEIFIDDLFDDYYHKVVTVLPTLKPRPTAIVAHSDYSAIPILQGLHDLGWRVPEDISLVGYDDLAFAPYLRPGLTTMAQPGYRIGEMGAEILLERLAQPEGSTWQMRHIALQSELVLRCSTAPPANHTRSGEK